MPRAASVAQRIEKWSESGFLNTDRKAATFVSPLLRESARPAKLRTIVVMVDPPVFMQHAHKGTLVFAS